MGRSECGGVSATCGVEWQRGARDKEARSSFYPQPSQQRKANIMNTYCLASSFRMFEFADRNGNDAEQIALFSLPLWSIGWRSLLWVGGRWLQSIFRSTIQRKQKHWKFDRETFQAGSENRMRWRLSLQLHRNKTKLQPKLNLFQFMEKVTKRSQRRIT